MFTATVPLPPCHCHHKTFGLMHHNDHWFLALLPFFTGKKLLLNVDRLISLLRRTGFPFVAYMRKCACSGNTRLQKFPELLWRSMDLGTYMKEKVQTNSNKHIYGKPARPLKFLVFLSSVSATKIYAPILWSDWPAALKTTQTFCGVAAHSIIH